MKRHQNQSNRAVLKTKMVKHIPLTGSFLTWEITVSVSEYKVTCCDDHLASKIKGYESHHDKTVFRYIGWYVSSVYLYPPHI